MQLPSNREEDHMPRYLSLFKYTPEGRKGLMKAKAAAREAALKLTIESAGGKLELFNWTVSGSDYSGVTIAEFPDASTYTAVVSLIEATGAFSEIEAIELLTASEIDRGLGKSPTYRARGAYRLGLIRSLPEPTGEPMKRRSKVGGGPIQGRRPKTPKPTRR